MKKIFLLIVVFANFSYANADQVDTTDPAKMSEVASKILSAAEIDMIGARGAAQISQLADQAQLQLSKIIIKQNDEIVRLLRKISEKK